MAGCHFQHILDRHFGDKRMNSVFELVGEKVRNTVGQLDFSLIDKHTDCRTDKGLAYRIHTVQSVFIKRLPISLREDLTVSHHEKAVTHFVTAVHFTNVIRYPFGHNAHFFGTAKLQNICHW